MFVQTMETKVLQELFESKRAKEEEIAVDSAQLSCRGIQGAVSPAEFICMPYGGLVFT